MKVLTYAKMPLIEKILFIINWILCGFARACVLLLSYPKLAVFFGENSQMLQASTITSSVQQSKARLIKRSIALSARYTPWESSCLTQAIVALWWCNVLKIPYYLFIGLEKNTKLNEKIIAHAWVTSGPIAITGGYCWGTHHVIACYSNLRRQCARS